MAGLLTHSVPVLSFRRELCLLANKKLATRTRTRRRFHCTMGCTDLYERWRIWRTHWASFNVWGAFYCQQSSGQSNPCAKKIWTSSPASLQSIWTTNDPYWDCCLEPSWHWNWKCLFSHARLNYFGLIIQHADLICIGKQSTWFMNYKPR